MGILTVMLLHHPRPGEPRPAFIHLVEIPIDVIEGIVLIRHFRLVTVVIRSLVVKAIVRGGSRGGGGRGNRAGRGEGAGLWGGGRSKQK